MQSIALILLLLMVLGAAFDGVGAMRSRPRH